MPTGPPDPTESDIEYIRRRVAEYLDQQVQDAFLGVKPNFNFTTSTARGAYRPFYFADRPEESFPFVKATEATDITDPENPRTIKAHLIEPKEDRHV